MNFFVMISNLLWTFFYPGRENNQHSVFNESMLIMYPKYACILMSQFYVYMALRHYFNYIYETNSLLFIHIINKDFLI